MSSSRSTHAPRWRSPALPLLLLSLAAACAPGHGAPPAMPTPTAAPAALPHALVPLPASVEIDADSFTITETTRIVVEPGSDEALRIGEQLARILRPSTGHPVPVEHAAGAAPAGSIALRLAADRASLGDEGYELRIGAAGVVLLAHQPAGLFRGVQTLRQLFPYRIESHESVLVRTPYKAPGAVIVDQPRFAWRGSMLDVARHFFTVDEVKQHIDLLALYKFNVLHLHLTDDQGWRIQIDSWPRLTEVGSKSQVGGGEGGFYTKADYAELVRYAQERYITLVPEIDMPGHTNAALVAYPEFSCGKREPAVYTGIQVGFSALCADRDTTYRFIDDVLGELAAMTPGPYLHVGGDEVEALTREEYAGFIERVQQIVHRHGKRMIGWEEITKARLDPTSVAQQWRTDSATAALSYGSKLVLSPSERIYIDMKYHAGTELGHRWAAMIELKDAYDWDPATRLEGVGEEHILGVEAPLWSETIRNITAAHFLAMPRLPAVAEVGWSAQDARQWDDFRARLAAHAPRWRMLGINYYPTTQVDWHE
jgi:hexosaminidase